MAKDAGFTAGGFELTPNGTVRVYDQATAIAVSANDLRERRA